ncbi:Phosphocarrier protein HPr [Candidatus Izimaplasma bacterium HR1]|jgi:phosphocarrier protein|uniref:HPr family phosphocarrier protein n=1 Tax=Candidatus Izimoplasma sp. HR1 TaxID=1541959 RepID=UPI0004F78687|nr:Phosphocarrier protein HPr [Candidatus Izimaplasma bacterium HR1]
MKSEITINSTAGLHAALASKIVQVSGKYEADVFVQYENDIVNAKNILGLISLAVPQGRDVKVVCSGKDAEKALKDIKKILS